MNRIAFYLLIAACVLSLAPDALACSVCQGNPDSDLSKGAQAGVLLMVVITYGVVLSFVGTAALWFVRVRRSRLRQMTAVAEDAAV